VGHNHELISAHLGRLRASGYPATVVWSAEGLLNRRPGQKYLTAALAAQFPTVGSPAAVTAGSYGHGAPNSLSRHVWGGRAADQVVTHIVGARLSKGPSRYWQQPAVLSRGCAHTPHSLGSDLQSHSMSVGASPIRRTNIGCVGLLALIAATISCLHMLATPGVIACRRAPRSCRPRVSREGANAAMKPNRWRGSCHRQSVAPQR
jgi:hypothetical protein